MTSPCELQIYTPESKKAQTVAKEILHMAKGLEKKYNFYDPKSYLSALNERKVAELDLETKELLRRAKLFYTQTQGLFDITMGTLTKARKLPTTKEIEEAIIKLTPSLGVEHFDLKKDRLSFDNPYTKIDLGGLVKEYAVDKAVKLLRKAKISAALVNFGGDIYALGSKPQGKPFIIGIKNPHDPSQYLTHMEIQNQALTTSASYERSHQVEADAYSHIITTSPMQSEILSTTVIAPSTVEAGVFSTALMLQPQLKHRYESLLIAKDLTLHKH